MISRKFLNLTYSPFSGIKPSVLKSLIGTLSSSPIINQHLHSNDFIHRLDIFPYFHSQNTNTDRIYFFNFENVSNFYWKFYVFKFKSFCRIFMSFYNFCWVIVLWMQLSDWKRFKALSIIDILIINQTLS